MLRTVTLAAFAAALAAPAFAGSGCNYGHAKQTTASVDTGSFEYAPVAATATEEVGLPQSAPIDASAIVYETDAVIETVEPVIIPEG